MIHDIQAVSKALEEAVAQFTDIAVVGVSGGVDSSVVAAICVAALGTENVHLVSMPHNEIDVQTFNARSAEVAQQLGAPHHVVSIGKASDTLAQSLERVLEDTELNQLSYANIRPRIRMAILYGISGELGFRHNQRVRVMGTGHMSEDLIGYDTKGGDALCDIFILSDLVKSEVYQLAEHYNLPESIRSAEPSAGLYPGQTDEQELGYSYDQLEKPTLAVFEALKGGLPREALNIDHAAFQGLDPETVAFVIERYQAHFHKHEAAETVPLREHAEWFLPR